jgi:hypothetical protein
MVKGHSKKGYPEWRGGLKQKGDRENLPNE